SGIAPAASDPRDGPPRVASVAKDVVLAHGPSVTAGPAAMDPVPRVGAAGPEAVAGSAPVPLAAVRDPAVVGSARPQRQGREARVTRPAVHRSPDSPAAARGSARPRVAGASAPCRAAAVPANHGQEASG